MHGFSVQTQYSQKMEGLFKSTRADNPTSGIDAHKTDDNQEKSSFREKMENMGKSFSIKMTGLVGDDNNSVDDNNSGIYPVINILTIFLSSMQWTSQQQTENWKC